MKRLLFLLIFLPYCLSFAQVCKDKNSVMQTNNRQVVNWIEFMENQFQARAYVNGTIARLLEDRQGHVHWEIDLDNNLATTDDHVEIIYNIKYGAIPEWIPGDRLIACGDFIKDPYSPLKGVIHWLHINERQKNGHEDGFLIINGQLTGRTLKNKN